MYAINPIYIKELKMRKLLDTTGGNTKIKKTMSSSGMALCSLSLMPDRIICAGSKAAGCFDDCIKVSGLSAIYKSINEARQRKTDYWHQDREAFLNQLNRELFLFEKNCHKKNLKPVARLNVFSDIAYENFSVPQNHPNIFMYDYTKIVSRLNKPLPNNYRLMFSYSGRSQYQKSVERCPANVPMSVVFKCNKKDKLPAYWSGPRGYLPVIDGDVSDLINVNFIAGYVGLRSKGQGFKNSNRFVVDANEIIRVAA
jgi:hypothetical protein